MASTKHTRNSSSGPASPAFHRFRVARPEKKPSIRLEQRSQFLNSNSSSSRQKSEPTLPACQRCKHLKKKCSRTRPECDQCVHSAIECSYLSMDLEKKSIAELEAKVERLTQFIEANVMHIPSSPNSSRSIHSSHSNRPTGDTIRESITNQDSSAAIDIDSSMPHPDHPIEPSSRFRQASSAPSHIENQYAASTASEPITQKHIPISQLGISANVSETSNDSFMTPTMASTEAAANILSSMAPMAPSQATNSRFGLSDTGSRISSAAMLSVSHDVPPFTGNETNASPTRRPTAVPMTPISIQTSDQGAVKPDGNSIAANLRGSSTDSWGRENQQQLQLSRSTQATREVPQDAACFRFVDAYFRHVHRVYPFIDRKAVLADRQKILELAQNYSPENSNKLYLIMAIGCTTLQRSGQVPSETSAKFKIPYGDIIHKCLMSTTVESVETLFLLSLYSLFDPTGMSPWSLVGILTRQAIAVGITRKTPVTEGQGFQTELQNRLYWSVYVLDRMLSVTMGLPVGMNDDHSDVPLPGLIFDDRDPAELTSLQVSRHVIQLRQIEDSILKTIHLPNAKTISQLSLSAKDAIISDLRTQVENWYSQGCLLSPAENDNIPFHNTITWTTVRYYNLLIMLYSPSHFTMSSREQHLELQRYAQKYVQCSCLLLQRRQLPLNWITLYRFLSICSIFLYCFVRAEVEQGKPFLAQDEVLRCAEILEAFPSSWSIAGRSALIFRQLASLITYTTNGRGNMSSSSLAQWDFRQSSQKDSLVRKWFSEVKNGSMGMVREVLGRNSAFCFTDYLIEHSKDLNDTQLLGGFRSIFGVGTVTGSEPSRMNNNMDIWEYEGAPLWDAGMEYF